MVKLHVTVSCYYNFCLHFVIFPHPVIFHPWFLILHIYIHLARARAKQNVKNHILIDCSRDILDCSPFFALLPTVLTGLLEQSITVASTSIVSDFIIPSHARKRSKLLAV